MTKCLTCGASTAVKLVYVAGPYRAASGWLVDLNIQEARMLGARVAHVGAYPVIPHSNTAHFDGLAPDALWLGGTLELMRRCDAVIFAERWEQSTGSRAERAEAMQFGLPVFDSISQLAAWLPNVQCRCAPAEPEADGSTFAPPAPVPVVDWKARAEKAERLLADEREWYEAAKRGVAEATERAEAAENATYCLIEEVRAWSPRYSTEVEPERWRGLDAILAKYAKPSEVEHGA